MSRARAAAIIALALAGAAATTTAGDPQQLAPTPHPAIPGSLDQIWYAPRTTTHGDLADAAALLAGEDYAKALDLLQRLPPSKGPLAGYTAYFTGQAQLKLDDADGARASFRAAQSAAGVGHLAQAAALAEAEADQALDQPDDALAIYDRVSAGEDVFDRPAILLQQANAAVELQARDTAVRVYRLLYYEYPLTDSGLAAAAALEKMDELPPVSAGTAYAKELARADALFDGRRWAEAGKAYARLVSLAHGNDRERLDVRIAEADYFTHRYRPARDRLRRHMDAGPFRAEATYYWALTVNALRATDAYERALRQLVEDDGGSPFVQDALNELGTHYVVDDEDEQADVMFRQLYDRAPTGRFAERAAWKIGWWAYKHARYADTIRVFERAAADFPRSDYRPSWLYWLGRAYDVSGDRSQAQARYDLVVADYRNSYYGRLASARLTAAPALRRVRVGTPADASPPPNADVIRALLGAELYDAAVDELRYAQAMWGDSPALQATLAWALNRRGDFRPAINAMKRAYPQYLAAGGENLPRDVLTILFPIDYWPSIQQDAAQHHLDPYLVAALVAQESTFDADIRSGANAYGLMQLLPSTARRYAPKVGLRYSRRLLTDADANLRMGTAYFADLVAQFGDVHLALAGYNAGEDRVVDWIAERPGMDREEFIDDIPFPETQNYVKRILGTAEDYRILYGGN